MRCATARTLCCACPPACSPLPHSLYDPEAGTRLCLFVKDPVKATADKLAERPVPGFVEVMGYTRLSREFKQYAARRELLKSYDGFFVDDSILPMMPRVLGKVFYARKKQPWPVKMGGARSLENALVKARDSTPLYLGAGQCVAVKVGTTAHSPAQVAENVAAVVTAAVDAIPKKWRNVAGISLKLPASLALPIYASLPGDEASAAAGATTAAGGQAPAHESPASGTAGGGSAFEDSITWDEEGGEGAAPASTPASTKPTRSKGAKRTRSSVKAPAASGEVVGSAKRPKRRAAAPKRFFGK